jgi:hypothetical protein
MLTTEFLALRSVPIGLQAGGMSGFSALMASVKHNKHKSPTPELDETEVSCIQPDVVRTRVCPPLCTHVTYAKRFMRNPVHV